MQAGNPSPRVIGLHRQVQLPGIAETPFHRHCVGVGNQPIHILWCSRAVDVKTDLMIGVVGMFLDFLLARATKLVQYVE